jgi:GAF domain-containing protein
MLWGLFWSILAVFAVLCVITEIYLKRRVQAGVMTPLQTSYCKYVVATDQPLVIADSLTDIRVRTADGETKRNVRAYIGAPVHSAEGIPVGSLCVFDVNPRDWTQRDQSIVSAFASLVVL